MCIAFFLLSLIPVLSSYVIYLAVAAVVSEGSPALQFTLTVMLLAPLLGGGVQLLGHVVQRPRT